MQVAFATQDNIHVDSHFGWAKKIDIYDVSSEGYNFLRTIDFGDDLTEDGNEDKLIPKIKAVTECTIVYVSAIGGGAASRLLKNKITPLKPENQEKEIIAVLNQLTETLKSPPPWLRKVIKPKLTRFDFEEDSSLEKLQEVASHDGNN